MRTETEYVNVDKKMIGTFQKMMEEGELPKGEIFYSKTGQPYFKFPSKKKAKVFEKKLDKEV